MGRQRREQRTAIDEEGPSRERSSRERTIGRQRREQWTAIDEEGPSRERNSGERAMGRQRREQRTAIDEEGASRERISGERAMGRQQREQRTAIDEEGASGEGSSEERTMGRQRREQWTAIDEDGVILLNFHTPCIFSLRWAKERSTAHGHQRKVRRIFCCCFPSLQSVQAPAYGHGRTGTVGINGVERVGRGYIVKFPHPMHFCLRQAKERSIRTRPLTASPSNFLFWFSFLAVGAGIGLRPWMDGRAHMLSTGWEGWYGVILLNFNTPCTFSLLWANGRSTAHGH